MPKDYIEPDVRVGDGFVAASAPTPTIDPEHLARLAERPFPSIDPDSRLPAQRATPVVLRQS